MLALMMADAGMAVAEEKGYLPLVWQLHAVRGRALEALGRSDDATRERDNAATTVAELAETIDNVDQQRGFLACAEGMMS